MDPNDPYGIGADLSSADSFLGTDTGGYGGSNGFFGAGYSDPYGTVSDSSSSGIPDQFGIGSSSPGYDIGGYGAGSLGADNSPTPTTNSWWNSPLGIAGINGLIGAAKGVFGSQAAQEQQQQNFDQAQQLQQMSEAAAMARLQAQLASQQAVAAMEAGAHVAAAKLSAKAQKFGDIASMYNNYANGLRATGNSLSNSFQGLGQLLQAPRLKGR